jgi:hypothetical protein
MSVAWCKLPVRNSPSCPSLSRQKAAPLRFPHGVLSCFVFAGREMLLAHFRFASTGGESDTRDIIQVHLIWYSSRQINNLQKEEEDRDETGCVGGAQLEELQLLFRDQTGKFSVLKVPRLCPLVLLVNHLTPNGHFSGRTAPLTYRCCIFYLFNKYTYWIF